MAEHLSLEQAMINGLKKQYQPELANDFSSRYFTARNKLYSDILPEIKKSEPDLTDHSEKHIKNVLNNAYKLIQEDINSLTGLDLYFLCQVILFHDVGNVFGRAKHNQSIGLVITDAFSDLFSGENSREKKLITLAGRAHTGKSNDGSHDTLKDLLDQSEHIKGDHIQFCDIAALVRFADELAEGPQRTSKFMSDSGMYSKDSAIFHDYASCTHIKIDSPNKRIIISYEINIKTYQQRITKKELKKLKNLLNYIYRRILKLNQERKYFNYYCKIPVKVREMQVSFNFIIDNNISDISFNNLILNDLTVPGSEDRGFVEDRPDLEIDTLLEKISNKINMGT